MVIHGTKAYLVNYFSIQHLRIQVDSRSWSENKEWEKKKFDNKKSSPTETWKSVKSCLGWGGGGAPTQLFSEGNLVTS